MSRSSPFQDPLPRDLVLEKTNGSNVQYVQYNVEKLLSFNYNFLLNKVVHV